jgi:hypothetical protein
VATRRVSPVPSILGLVLVGVVAIVDAEPRHQRQPAPQVRVVPAPSGVPWWYSPPPLPYSYYVEQALQQRLQQGPTPTRSFEGSSPRCPRFFCEVAR